MKEWGDSVAFITGGAQGIGLGIARALGKRGVRLALADVDEGALRAAELELSAVTDTAIYRLDVRDRHEFAAIADKVEANLGPVNLLFNNAGIAPYSSVSQLDYELWDLTLGVNVLGVVNGLQTFMPRMIANGGGYVVNTASGAGLVGGPNVLYTTSKYAVVGLSESLKLAGQKHGIDVSVLCPAFVATDILKNTQTLSGGKTVVQQGERLRETESSLEGGVSIDAVGEIVIAGMEAGATWIFTDDTMLPYVKMRAEWLVDAFAAPTRDDG